jgi:hypothetical protein
MRKTLHFQPVGQGSYWIRTVGSEGQEVIDADGRIVAWTVDLARAIRIVEALEAQEAAER